MPTPQMELFATIAISPAHRVPCLIKKIFLSINQLNLFTYFHRLDHISDLDHHHYHSNHNLILDHNSPSDPNFAIQDHHQELLL